MVDTPPGMSRLATTRVSIDLAGLAPPPAPPAPASAGTNANPTTPAPSAAPSPPPSRGFTRDQVLELGRTGDPYRSIPLAHQALAQHPDDAGVRFLLATNYARLLLRTPAAEQLDQLPAEAQSDTTTQSLRAVLAQLPSDAVVIRANAYFETNLQALEARRRDARTALDAALPTSNQLREALAQWDRRVEVLAARSLAPSTAPASSASAASTVAHNFLVRPRTGSDIPASAPGGWTNWPGDARAAVLAVPLDGAASPDTSGPGSGGVGGGGGAGRSRGPVVVEGLSPPLLFERVYQSTAQVSAHSANGYRLPIRLVQTDLGEFAFALTQADLSAQLADARVQVFLGPTAAEQLRAFLEARIDLQVLGPAYVNAGVVLPTSPHVHQVLTSIQSRQQDVLVALRQEVARTYFPRTAAWYAQRYATAESSPAEPLRVLVPTCRYSTFIRHSARDIAEAFRALDWEARVLEEPDEFSHLAAPSYLRAYAEFKPDLVVLINYTRANLNQPAPLGSTSTTSAAKPQSSDPLASLGDPSPFNIPFVCWVQDAMPHLFDERIGAAQTGFDFLAGHIHAELKSRYGYPNADVEAATPRALSMPVVVDSTRFHDGPIDADRRTRLSCDVAFASHHALPPQGLHDQIISGAQIDANLREIFTRLFPLIRDAVDRCGSIPLHRTLRALTENTARGVLASDQPPPPVLITRLVNNYAFPIADRMIRHDAVHWAANICRRRGWRLNLHGKGWDTVDALAEFSRGPLEHGEDLRASYQSAACHIHASIHWPYHQRVMECATSGGLPIYRFKHDDLGFFSAFARSTVAASNAPRTSWPEWPEVLQVAAADHPEALARLALLQRLGEPDGQSHAIAWNDDALAARRTSQGLTLDHDTVWLFGDPAELSFRSEAELERVIEKAVTRPAWRDNCSRGIRSRVLNRFTYHHAVESIARMVKDAMIAQAAGISAAMT